MVRQELEEHRSSNLDSFKDVEPRGPMLLTNAWQRPLPSGRVDDLQLSRSMFPFDIPRMASKVHALDQGKEQPHPHLYLFVVSGGFLRQSMPNQIVCLADSLTVFQSIRCSTIAQTNGITWFIIRLAGVSGFASTGCGTSHSRASDCKVLIGFTPPSPPHPAIGEPWRMHCNLLEHPPGPPFPTW